MNKVKKELIEKCIKLEHGDGAPILGGIYVIPTNLKHDSGYKIMYIIGHTPFKRGENQKTYLIDTYCDVIDYSNYLGRYDKIKDLHIDITPNGIIHIWSNEQNMKIINNLSSCYIAMVEKER